MIPYARYKFAEYLLNEFSSILSGPKDIINAKVNNVIEERLDDKEDNSGDHTYDFPFISFFTSQELPTLNEENYNHILGSEGAYIDINLNGEIIPMRFDVTRISWEVNFWEGQDQITADIFNRLWNAHQRHKTADVQTWHFLDENRQKTNDSLDFRIKYEYDSLTDNSNLEDQYDNGVQIRYTGTITVNNALIFSPVKPDKHPRIEKILVDYLFKQDNTNDVLIEETTIS